MSVSSRIASAPSPTRALSYWQGKRRTGNEMPALLFLWLALVVLVSLRAGRTPTAGEAATMGLFAGVIIVAGIWAPHLVTLLLVALLVAGILGFAGPVTGILQNVQTTVTGLIPHAAPLTGRNHP
jgi:hypothetical protein